MVGEWKCGWKVVSKYKYSLFSDCPVKYSFDHPTFRPEGCGPLAVFDTHKKANIFVTENCVEYYGKIIPCVYKESEDTDLWDDLGSAEGYFTTPIGTCFADTVILLLSISVQKVLKECSL